MDLDRSIKVLKKIICFWRKGPSPRNSTEWFGLYEGALGAFPAKLLPLSNHLNIATYSITHGLGLPVLYCTIKVFDLAGVGLYRKKTEKLTSTQKVTQTCTVKNNDL